MNIDRPDPFNGIHQQKTPQRQSLQQETRKKAPNDKHRSHISDNQHNPTYNHNCRNNIHPNPIDKISKKQMITHIRKKA